MGENFYHAISEFVKNRSSAFATRGDKFKKNKYNIGPAPAVRMTSKRVRKAMLWFDARNVFDRKWVVKSQKANNREHSRRTGIE